MRMLILSIAVVSGSGKGCLYGNTDQVEYSKDPRTGICFASLWFGFNNGLMTAVPCTPEVLALIK